MSDVSMVALVVLIGGAVYVGAHILFDK